MVYVSLCLGIIATIVFIFFRSRENSLRVMLFKVIASVFFTLTGCAALGQNPESDIVRAGLMVIMGLCFGILGDAFLDLKWVYPKDKDFYLKGGFGFFACGHICYFVFMLMTGSYGALAIIIAAVIAIAAGVFIFMTPEKMKVNYGKYRLISSMYAGVLIFVTVFSLALLISGSGIRFLFMTIALILFLASDLILSQTYFGTDKSGPKYIVANHALYYGAQFLLALSLLF